MSKKLRISITVATLAVRLLVAASTIGSGGVRPVLVGGCVTTVADAYWQSRCSHAHGKRAVVCLAFPAFTGRHEG